MKKYEIRIEPREGAVYAMKPIAVAWVNEFFAVRLEGGSYVVDHMPSGYKACGYHCFDDIAEARAFAQSVATIDDIDWSRTDAHDAIDVRHMEFFRKAVHCARNREIIPWGKEDE